MHVIEPGVDPLAFALPDGKTLKLHAAYPGGKETVADDPFFLPPPHPVFAPVVLETDLGPAALTFSTRERSVNEGPRRTSLAETVTLSTGRFTDATLADGMDAVDAPPWQVPVPNGRVPASMIVECSFPWASPSGRRTDLNIEYAREDGRGSALLMSTETLQSNQQTVSEAFHAFLTQNPGLPNALEKALATMDARVMRFEAGRIERVAEDQAKVVAAGKEREAMERNARTQALHLREGAEVIEENLDPEEVPNGFIR